MQTSLRVIKAPCTEPVSIVDAARHCRLDADDPVLPTMVSAARIWSEGWLGRALITQTLRLNISGLQGAPALPYYPGMMGRYGVPWGVGATGWKRPLELTRSPVQSIVRIAVQSADGGSYDLAAEHYVARLASEPGTLVIQGGQMPGPDDQVGIEFIAGYGNSQDDVPMPIRQGILLLTAFLYEHRGDAGGDPPPAAEMLMWPFRLVTFGG